MHARARALHRQLARLAGDGDRAAPFLSTWCPPPSLGGCSLAARRRRHGAAGANYDLSPDLNEGLLLRTEWTGMPVMGMVEFLWGLSDGVSAAGLSVALAFGGRSEVARGFGVTTILRYVLETCATVEQALAVLDRVPSHMAYNITLADRHGATATVELLPGGGARRMPRAIATNHQHGPEAAECSAVTRSEERREHLEGLFSDKIAPDALGDIFLRSRCFSGTTLWASVRSSRPSMIPGPVALRCAGPAILGASVSMPSGKAVGRSAISTTCGPSPLLRRGRPQT